jgi:hypothetical protein
VRSEASQFQTSPDKKVHKTPSQGKKNLAMVACTCHTSYTGSLYRRILVQARPGKKQDPISKITKEKRLGVWLKW